MTRGYVLRKVEFKPAVSNHGIVVGVVQTREALEMFREAVTNYKVDWFLHPAAMLRNPDWCVQINKIQQAVHTIQTQWRESLSNPRYKICAKRLMREFQELANL